MHGLIVDNAWTRGLLQHGPTLDVDKLPPSFTSPTFIHSFVSPSSHEIVGTVADEIGHRQSIMQSVDTETYISFVEREPGGHIMPADIVRGRQ